MLTVVLGLAGALVYGAADFFGGLAARRISALRVTALGALSGVVLLFLGTFVIAGEWSPEALFWGALSGVTGAAAIALLYACLAIGPMSILSPLTAVTSAIVPLTWGLVTGSQLGAIAYPAFATRARGGRARRLRPRERGRAADGRGSHDGRPFQACLSVPSTSSSTRRPMTAGSCRSWRIAWSTPRSW